MITFGYNSKFSSILRSLSAVAIGLVMVISTNATVAVVKIIAAFLFAAGVVSLIYGYINRKSGAMSLMSVNAAVDIVIGLLLYLFPTAVSGIIVTLIGVAILLFGILQLVVLTGTMSLVRTASSRGILTYFHSFVFRSSISTWNFHPPFPSVDVGQMRRPFTISGLFFGI